MPNSNDDMETPVTRRELREELAKFEERFEAKLEHKLEQKLDIKLGLWGGALMAEIRSSREQARRDKQELLDELARHTSASAERARAELRIVDDQYKTLPPRVETLEARVFGPPAPKRARRKRR